MMEEEGRYRGFDLSDSSANESVFVSSDFFFFFFFFFYLFVDSPKAGV